MRIQVVGCNHRTAPLAVREQVAFDPEQTVAALRALAGRYGGIEAMLISTCNRMEFYIARKLHGHPRVEDVLAFIAEFHGLEAGVPALGEQGAFYSHQDLEAVEHLMTVTTSLDSLVLGETQILGQVRQAVALAQQAGTLGPILSRLGNEAIATGKRVHTETNLSAGNASVASVAVTFARRIFERLDDKTVLLIGAGKMGEQTLARLVDQKPERVLVTNRSRPRAEALAGRHAGQVRDFENLGDALAEADIVVTSTAAAEPIITAKMVKRALKARGYRPIFLIDIAVPRDVAEDVARIDRVYSYNIDDLQQVVADNLDGRADHVAPARRVVVEQVESFMTWFRNRDLAPTIAALRQRVEQLGADELGWLMPKLSEAGPHDRELIEQFARRLVNKVLHGPTTQLGQLGQEVAGRNIDIYVHAVTRLFNLPDADEAEEQE